MDKKLGFEFSVENGYITDRGEFYRMFKSIMRLKSLTPAEKNILSVILSYTDNGQEFHMSNNRLAMEVGMDYSSVIRVIGGLKEKGFIKTYKVIDKSKHLIIGRIVTPQRQFMTEEIEKTWNEFEYEEY